MGVSRLLFTLEVDDMVADDMVAQMPDLRDWLVSR